jgi:hypothetical protein
MKKFQIYSHGQLIGESDLEFHDPGMNIYSGYLCVTPGHSNVRIVFKSFSHASSLTGDEQEIQLARYYRARDDLKLTVKSRESRTVLANWIHVVDIDDGLDEVQVEISLNEPVVEPSVA